MSNKTKKSRKATHFYNFNSSAGEVVIDLNNYVATCSVTGEPKKFYHAYLANLIQTKYDNCISTFEDTYVSRAGRSGQVAQNRLDQIESRITSMYDKINQLKAKRDELVS